MESALSETDIDALITELKIEPKVESRESRFLRALLPYLSPLSLLKACLVCKEWNTIASDGRVWNKIFAEFGGFDPSIAKLDDHLSAKNRVLTFIDYYLTFQMTLTLRPDSFKSMLTETTKYIVESDTCVLTGSKLDNRRLFDTRLGAWLKVPEDDEQILFDQKEFDVLFVDAPKEVLADNLYWTIDDFLGMRLGERKKKSGMKLVDALILCASELARRKRAFLLDRPPVFQYFLDLIERD